MSPDTTEVRVAMVQRNRHEPGTERTLGLFMDVLPMAVGVTDDPTFSELLVRARAAWLGAIAHRMSFWDILAAGGYAAEDGSPACDFELNYMPLSQPEPRVPPNLLPIPLRMPWESRVERWRNDFNIAPVSCVVYERPDGDADVMLGAPRSITSPSALKRIGKTFAELVRRVGERPPRSASEWLVGIRNSINRSRRPAPSGLRMRRLTLRIGP